MSLPRLKICGFTQIEQVRAAAAMPIDALGFIHHPKSPRHLEIAEIKALVRAAGPLQQRVGVFVDQPLADLIEIMRATGLGLAQLHGAEDLTYLKALDQAGIPWMKALRVKESADLRAIETLKLNYVLLDAKSDRAAGGTGESFDWSLAQEANLKCKVILAGGLTPDNVEEAITQVNPYGLDLSSGVESAPGIKDFAKIAKLLQKLGRLPC